MVDLKLVKVFITIFDTQSVSLAAQKLNITQPSVSHGLARLRHIFKDRLFTRTQQGMIPTAYAEKLYAALAQPLMDIEHVLHESKSFEVSKSDHCFKVAMSDLAQLYLLPKLLSKLSAIAPHIRIEMVKLEMSKLADELITGKVDAAICDRVLDDRQLNTLTLLQDQYVGVMHQQRFEQIYTGANTEQIVARFLKQRHVVVETLQGQDLVDYYLNQSGLQRNISLRISQFTLLAELIEKQHYVVILAAKIAQSLQFNAPVKQCELPFALPDLALSLHWHHKSSDAAAKKWFLSFLKHSLLLEQQIDVPSDLNAMDKMQNSTYMK